MTKPCTFCSDGFDENSPSKSHVHYVFRVHTKYGIYSGPAHCVCISKMADLQVSVSEPSANRTNRYEYGDVRTVTVLTGNGPIPFGRFETVHNGRPLQKRDPYYKVYHREGEEE